MINVVGTGLSQWDTGRTVIVTESGANKVHFANPGDSHAPILDLVDGVAKIPDYLLRTGKPLCAYAVLDGVTLEGKTFPVKNRERPENYVYEDDQRNYIYKLIDDAQAATEAANQVAEDLRKAKENGEFNGKDGADGKDGTQVSIETNTVTTPAGRQTMVTISARDPSTNTMVQSEAFTVYDGKDGATPVRGTDYWTDEDKSEITDYVDEQLENYYTKDETDTALNGKISKTLLWENASKTSGFAAQSISVAKIGSYHEVEVEFGVNLQSISSDGDVQVRAAVPVDKAQTTKLFPKGMAIGVSGGAVLTRTFGRAFSGGAVEFSAGKTNTTTANVVLVPYRIYGIKGVIL